MRRSTTCLITICILFLCVAADGTAQEYRYLVVEEIPLEDIFVQPEGRSLRRGDRNAALPAGTILRKLSVNSNSLYKVDTAFLNNSESKLPPFLRALKFEIPEASYGRTLYKFKLPNRYLKDGVYKEIAKSVSELALAEKLIRNGDLAKAFEAEIAFALSGSTKQIPAKNFASFSSTGGKISLGHTFAKKEAVRRGIRVLTTVGISASTTDGDLIFAGATNPTEGFAGTVSLAIMRSGKLRGGDARRGELARDRLRKLGVYYLTNAEPRIRRLDSIAPPLRKDSIKKMQAGFWTSDLKEFESRSNGFTYRKLYFPIRASLGFQKTEVKFYEPDTPVLRLDTVFRAYEVGAGIGWLLREKATRHNIEATFQLAHAHTGQTSATRAHKRTVAVPGTDGVLSVDEQKGRVGRFEQFIQPSAKVRYTVSRIRKDASDSFSFGGSLTVEYAMNTRASVLGEDFERERIKLGPLLYFFGGKKVTAILYPHLDVRDGKPSGRVSVGLPF